MSKKIKKIHFINSDYERCVNSVDEMSDEQQSEIIDRYPVAKKMFTGLIVLINNEQNGLFVDDWECDLANHIWPEIQRK